MESSPSKIQVSKSTTLQPTSKSSSIAIAKQTKQTRKNKTRKSTPYSIKTMSCYNFKDEEEVENVLNSAVDLFDDSDGINDPEKPFFNTDMNKDLDRVEVEDEVKDKEIVAINVAKEEVEVVETSNFTPMVQKIEKIDKSISTDLTFKELDLQIFNLKENSQELLASLKSQKESSKLLEDKIEDLELKNASLYEENKSLKKQLSSSKNASEGSLASFKQFLDSLTTVDLFNSIANDLSCSIPSVKSQDQELPTLYKKAISNLSSQYKDLSDMLSSALDNMGTIFLIYLTFRK